MDQAIDQRDDAGSMREHPAPLGEGLVGTEEDGLLRVVAKRDHLEQQVGLATVVGEKTDLIDAEQLRRGVAAQPSSQDRRRVLCGELGEHVASGLERTVCPRLSACCATFFKIMVLVGFRADLTSPQIPQLTPGHFAITVDRLPGAGIPAEVGVDQRAAARAVLLPPRERLT